MTLQLFGAATAALTIALALGLQNPFWAAMPVWVVAQAFREDLVLRAGLRVLGTMAGAIAGWAVLTELSHPASRILALGLIVGAGVAAAVRIGTIHSYGALMTAITAVVVVLPALDHPLDSAAYAADRFLCTLIGVAAVTIATFPFTKPRSAPRPARVPGGLASALQRGGLAGLAAILGGLAISTHAGPAALAGGLSLAIFGSIVGASTDPSPILRSLVPGILIGVTAALAYRAAAVALDLDGFGLLGLAVPFLLGGALLRTHPRTAPLGLDANMCFLLAAEVGAHGHPLAFHLIGGSAMVLDATLIVGAGRWMVRPAPSRV